MGRTTQALASLSRSAVPQPDASEFEIFHGSRYGQRWRPFVEFAPGATEARKQFQEQALAAIHAVAEQERAPIA
jgi:hypothetical protein